jgi:PmbA protein
MSQEAIYQEKVAKVLARAHAKGASGAEVSFTRGQGLSVSVRRQALETVEHHEDQGLAITVYFGQQKGSADTSDLSETSMEEALDAACHIAEFTLPDPCAGLIDKAYLATSWPELDLHHPYPHDIETAIALAMRCEKQGLDYDPRINNSEGASFNTYTGLSVYGNSHGFLASTRASTHQLSLSLIAEVEGKKERDYSYTSACVLEDLWTAERVAEDAAKRTLQRLGPRKISTQKVPILFEANVAGSLISAYLKGVSGGHLYRRTTCFIDSLESPIFPPSLSLYEDPFIPRKLGSSPFDAEGARIHPQYLVEKGVVKTYLLGSYSARQLGLQTTGHAGGVRTLFVQNETLLDFENLLKTMGRGLLVTELIGQGLNLVTGDYSRGASGFWVEEGKIQFPVSEVTIAGNLKTMLKNIVAVGSDVDPRHKIKTGSLLISEMMLAGT